MLSMEMYPTLALGPQRMADSFYRGESREGGTRGEDREAEERRSWGGEREDGIPLRKSNYLSE